MMPVHKHLPANALQVLHRKPTHTTCRLAVGAVAGVGLLLLKLTPAWALVIRPMPAQERLARAEVVVVGRVLSLEKQTVKVPSTPQAKNPLIYRIALVKVQEQIKGNQLPDTLRLGFLVPEEPTPKPGEVRPPDRPVVIPIPPRRRIGGLNLLPGDEGLFFLQKHPSGGFYEVAMFGGFTSSQVPNFLNEYQAVKRAAKLLADPQGGLQSPSAADRLLTAHLLLLQYHLPPPNGNFRKELLDAEQSRLILKAILEADWTPRPQGPNHTEPTPQQVFYQLGISPQDGWRPPTNVRDPQQINQAMQTWLREHLTTYRIPRYVPTTPPMP